MNANPHISLASVEPVIRLDGIERHFGAIKALRGITLSLHPGRGLALVGESGCGKTTCARIIARMDRPSAGRLHFQGRDFTAVGSAADEKAYRRNVQMVFQDPFSSLNPVFSVEHHLSRPIVLHNHASGKAAIGRAVTELLNDVGLEPDITRPKFPHELSGGQRQRVNIARALAVQPSVLVADEPTSMLDVSIRMGVLELLARIKREKNLALLYITHDIATAAHVSEEIVVMYSGQMVEWGDTHAVIGDPRHPYTQLLLSAVPDGSRPFVAGDSARFLQQADRIRKLSAPTSIEVKQVDANHFVRSVAEHI